MLPDFPRLKERLLRLALYEHRGRIQADELIGAVRAIPYFEGRGFAAGDVAGHVEHTKAEVTAIPYKIERSAIIERGFEALRECLAKAAELQIQAMHEMFLRKLDETTARVGHQVDAGGQPFSAELYLKMLETVQINFDALGRPKIPSMILHPDQADRVRVLMEQWQEDETFQQRYKEIMLKKRDEWRDRESNRKLVD